MSERIARPFEVTHRDVWRIALPATLAFITEPLVGLVDITVIGRLGDTALLGGLVLGALVFDVVFSLVFFLRLGTAGLTAQAVGAADPREGLVHLMRASLVAIALGIVLIAATQPIVWISFAALSPDPEVVAPLVDYLQVRMWSAPLVMLNYALLGWFFGRAAAKTGMALQIFLNVVHGALSIWFVHGLGWGVPGVALGVVIAQALTVGLGAALVVRRFGSSTVLTACSDPELFDRAALLRLFGLSRDLMIRSAALVASYGYFTAQTSRAGVLELGANAVIENLWMLTAYFLDGLGQSAEQLCGKAIGANWRPAFERGMRLSIVWGFAIALVLLLVWIAFGGAAIDLMTTSEDVRAKAREYFWWGALSALTGALPFVMDGVMTGATLNAIIRNGMVASLAIFLVTAALLQPLWGIHGLWAALHIFLLSRGAIFYFAVRGQMPRLFQQSDLRVA